jgi:hypothetical protein
MKKMFRTLVFGVVIATPLLLVPHQSKAGGLLDGIGQWLTNLFNSNKKNNAPTTNSVPLDGGTVFLVITGLGMGGVMLYKRFTKVENSVV